MFWSVTSKINTFYKNIWTKPEGETEGSLVGISILIFIFSSVHNTFMGEPLHTKPDGEIIGLFVGCAVESIVVISIYGLK